MLLCLIKKLLYKYVDLLASQIFGESVGNCCWRYFNLAKSYSYYTFNSYEAILASFKFGGRTKNCQTAKLKSPPNKLHLRYILMELPLYTEDVQVILRLLLEHGL